MHREGVEFFSPVGSFHALVYVCMYILRAALIVMYIAYGGCAGKPLWGSRCYLAGGRAGGSEAAARVRTGHGRELDLRALCVRVP